MARVWGWLPAGPACSAARSPLRCTARRVARRMIQRVSRPVIRDVAARPADPAAQHEYHRPRAAPARSASRQARPQRQSLDVLQHQKPSNARKEGGAGGGGGGCGWVAIENAEWRLWVSRQTVWWGVSRRASTGRDGGNTRERQVADRQGPRHPSPPPARLALQPRRYRRRRGRRRGDGVSGMSSMAEGHANVRAYFLVLFSRKYDHFS